jgi:hypothetical protein
MKPIEVITDFCDCNKQGDVRGQIEQLVRIALVTDNCEFDGPEE